MRYTVLVVLAVLSVAGCTAQAPAPGPSSQPQARPGQEVVVPEHARLEAAAKQYAPVEIGADVSALPANEQQALAKLVRAGWVMDALFLRQVWAGNEAMLLRPAHRQSAAGPGPAALLPDQQGAVGPPRPQRGVHRRGTAEARGGELLSRRREEGRRGSLAEDAARGAARGGDRLLHHHPAVAREGGLRRRALQPGVPGRAGARGRSAARGGGADDAADAEGVPREARRRVPQQRLLRQRRRVDGTRRQHRADHRAVRGLRGRVVQLEGGVRGVHRRARRCGDGEAGEARRRSCRTSRTPADRPEHSQPEARRAGADPRGQRGSRGRRRQPRRPDGRVQPAERRARRPREGRQARDAAEHPGGEVQARAGADCRAGAGGRCTRRTSPSTRSSRTSSCTS